MIDKIHKTMTPILTYYFAILFGYSVLYHYTEAIERLLIINAITLSAWFGGKATENIISKYKGDK